MLTRYPKSSLIFVVAMAALLSVFSKQTLTRVEPFTFSWLQIATGVIFLSIHYFVISRHRLSMDLAPASWRLMIGIAILNFITARLFFMFALEHLSVVTHAYVINFTGVVTMVLSVILLNQHPRFLQWIGALITMIGLHIYFGQLPEDNELIGLVYAGLVVLSLALTNNLVKLLLSREMQLNPMSLSVWTALTGGGALAISGLLYSFSNWQTIDLISVTDWGVIIANGFFVITLGLTVFNYVLTRLASFEVSLMASSGVIFSAFFSWLILDDLVNKRQVVGIIILLVGLVLVQIKKMPRLQRPNER